MDLKYLVVDLFWRRILIRCLHLRISRYYGFLEYNYGQKNHEKNLPNLNVGTGQCGVGGERQSSGAIACMYKLCFLSAPWRRKEGGPNDVVFMPKPQNVINLFWCTRYM